VQPAAPVEVAPADLSAPAVDPAAPATAPAAAASDSAASDSAPTDAASVPVPSVLDPSAASASLSGTPLSPGATLRAVREMQHERRRSMINVDGWVEVQERTFLRWTNFQLARGRQPPLADLHTGFADGVSLCALVELLSKQSLPARPNRVAAANSQIVRLDNLRLVFNFLEKQKGLHLVNIRPADIEQGNLKLVLGLVWGLIQKYQIIDAARPSPSPPPQQEDGAAVADTTAPVSSAAAAPESGLAKQELLAWVNAQIEPYQVDDAPVGTVSDFSRAWQDGRVLTALVESLDTSDAEARSLSLTRAGDALASVEFAVKKAESLLGVPALMDPVDIVHRPQEHSLMTYISLLREAQGRREEEAAEKALAARQAQDMEAIVVPLSPMNVHKIEQGEEDAPALGAVHDDEVVEHEQEQPQDDGAKDAVEEDALSAEELAAMAQRTRTDTHHALVGAYIDPTSLEAAVSPRAVQPAQAAMVPLPDEDAKELSDPEQEKVDVPPPEDAEKNIQPVEADLPVEAPAAVVDATPKHDAAAPDLEDYSEGPAEDAEGKLPNETLQQSLDRRIEKLLGAIEICVVTASSAAADAQRYLQSDLHGGSSVRAQEVNTVAATWQILDGLNGWKFLRDHQSRYLCADAEGRVSTSKKSPDCRWRIVRGQTQHFVDSHGRFLAVITKGGNTVVKTEEEKSDHTKFKICFPVIEGVLQKKGTSGLHRWQERYFAFNGNVMSYWRKQSSVGKERPDGIWHPARMQSVNINRSIAKRFNIVFIDGKVVELLAPTMEEAIRWVRGLNSRGIKTVQQSKRMSVVTDTKLLLTPAGAPIANPLEAAAAAAAARFGKKE